MKNIINKVLGFIVGGFVMFGAITIDSLGNPVYNKVFIIWALLAIVSTLILRKTSNFFED
jgi:hypothetical protein